MRRTVVCAVVSVSLLLPVGAAADDTVPDDLPEHVPAAATRPTREVPALPAADWPFAEAFPRTAGTGRLADGASYWTDWVYDDRGATTPVATSFNRRASQEGFLAPSAGFYDYPEGPAAGNGADVFRAAVGRTTDASWWRVDWTTLTDPSVPLAVWTLDTDADPTTGTDQWPAGARVASAGIDVSLVVSGTSATLVDADGTTTDVVAQGGRLVVDPDTRSFVVRVPDEVLPVAGEWTVRLGAGLAADDGTTLADPAIGLLPGDDALLGASPLPRLYNVAFRTREQEPPVFGDGDTAAGADALEGLLATLPGAGALGLDGLVRSFTTANMWNEDHQADALAGGEVSQFGLTVDWDALAAGASTAEPRPTGVSTRWYVAEELGDGVVPDAGTGPLPGTPSGDHEPNFLARVQPYSIYVPTTYQPGRPAPLTWILHSLAVNHNQYTSFDPRLVQQLCEDRGAICVTTLGRGPDGWYFDEAEADFWEVWRDVAEHYDLDPQRTTISGYSMGGWASWKLGLAHPDLFAAAMPIAGPITCGTGLSDQARLDLYGDERCSADGRALPLIGNSRWLPYAVGHSVIDELAPVSQSLEITAAMSDLGNRHSLVLYSAGEHLALAVQDRFDDLVDLLPDTTREQRPATFSHTWFPNLDDERFGIGATGVWWVDDLAARDTAPGTTARLDATSTGLPGADIVTAAFGPTPDPEPIPALVQGVTWDRTDTPAGRDGLELDLTNVGSVTVDAVEASFACGDVVTTTDGRTALTLAGLAPATTAERDGEVLGRAGGDGTLVVDLTGAQTTRVCAAGGAAGPAPGPQPLPATGGGAGAVAAAALLAGVALRGRRG